MRGERAGRARGGPRARDLDEAATLPPAGWRRVRAPGRDGPGRRCRDPGRRPSHIPQLLLQGRGPWLPEDSGEQGVGGGLQGAGGLCWALSKLRIARETRA